MSKSAGEFLTLQTLVDKGVHPLAYRLMCLQAHYRSELEFTFDNLLAALTRLKRMVMITQQYVAECQEDADFFGDQDKFNESLHDDLIAELNLAISDDLNTPQALVVLDKVLAAPGYADDKRKALRHFDDVLGLNLLPITRANLRIRPADAVITPEQIDHQLDLRKEARRNKNFPAADAIRNELIANGVEIMDGDPLRWEWRIEL